MSYILKALKKSEAERAKGTVPRLTAQQTVALRRRGAVWPWIVSAALLVNAAVVGLAWGPEIPLFGTKHAEPIRTDRPPVADAAAVTATAPAVPGNVEQPMQPVAPAPPRQTQPAAVEAAPADVPAQPRRTQPAARGAEPSDVPAPPRQAQPAAPEAAPSDVPAPPRRTQPAAREAAPSDVPAQTAETPTTSPRAAPAPSTGQERETRSAAASDVAANNQENEPLPDPARRAPVKSPAVSPPPARAAPDTTVIPKPPRKPVAALKLAMRQPALDEPIPLDGGARAPAARDSDLAVLAPAPAPVEPEAPVEPDPYASVPMLWQLPSVIRSKLPKLSMSVHVYAPQEASRFVIVNRKKYREGDVLDGGVKLVAIVADGIVLEHLGRRYRIGN